MVPLVLASGSPRRRELLTALGFRFDVAPTHIDETPLVGEEPAAYALRVAEAKALASPVADRVVLAADTVVSLDGNIELKADRPNAAMAALARLSGRTHAVLTAVVARRGPERMSAVVTTEVRFRRLSSAEIVSYVETGEPLDKAGSYGFQGRGAALIAAVEGSTTNVIGLPLEETLELLGRFGVRPDE